MNSVSHILGDRKSQGRRPGKKGFPQEDPFVESLDQALKSFRVERTFVGNHVHTTLKVYTVLYIHYHSAILYIIFFLQSENIKSLCSAPLQVAQSKCQVANGEVYSSILLVCSMSWMLLLSI